MQRLANIIAKIIDFFYSPFQKIVPQQVFRYACCGSGNMILDWVLYFLFYHFLALPLSQDGVVRIGLLAITPHILAFCIVFPITLLTGFWLNKYVTFTQSSLHGARQLLRYILVVSVNLAINYFGLKLLVETFFWYPTPSKMFITLVTILISFFGQKYFSFRK